MSVADLKTALLDKDEEINELKSRLKLQGEMKYNGVFYFKQSGESEDGPYCPQCYDNDAKLIRLTNYGIGWFDCKTCKSRYEEDIGRR